MKLSKILLMVVLSVFVSTGVLASGEDIKITIDGVELHTETSSKIVNNRTLVPMRAIFEAMGAKVEWDNKTRTAIGIKDHAKINLQINNPEASINGKEITLDSPAIIDNDRTLVPVRFIAESLGSNVSWNNKTRTVVIKNKSKNEVLEYTEEKYFEFDKEKGEIIAYKDDAPKDVAIPKTISGVTVKSIGDNAFREKDLTSIIIPESVISIGEFGLLGNELTSVVIPPNIKSIELYAFACNKLSSVIIPSGVTSIENSVFDSNPITSVTISAGVTGIDEYAFYDYVEIIRE